MKKTYITLLLLFTVYFTFAQAPQGINYQAVIRNLSGNILANQNVGLKINIRTGGASGSVIYSEVHNAITNAYGLVNLVIGQGNAQIGTFSGISWGVNSHFAEIQADITGGTNYQTIGNQQLMSVPYALYAENANEKQTLALNGNNLSISNGNSISLPINNIIGQGVLMKQTVPSWLPINDVGLISCVTSNSDGTVIYIATQLNGVNNYNYGKIHRLEKDINGYFQYTNYIEPFGGGLYIRSMVVLGNQLYFSYAPYNGSPCGIGRVGLDLSNLVQLSINPTLPTSTNIAALSTEGTNLFVYTIPNSGSEVWKSYQIISTALIDNNQDFTFSVPSGNLTHIGFQYCVFDGLNYYASGYNFMQNLTYLVKYDINKNYIADSLNYNSNIGNYSLNYLFTASLSWNAIMQNISNSSPVYSPVFTINPFIKL